MSNNLANSSTNGFKRSHAVFEDLIYQNLRQSGSATSEQSQLPTGSSRTTWPTLRPTASSARTPCSRI
ncbi:hypothetical protein [Mycobacterium tuberculosis]|uniref:hypothetical protein n=1 Tax=Mycobacterium tuberculosis TaxID=1773 RepID=UPI003510B2A1